MKISSPKIRLWLEFLALFGAGPVALYLWASHLGVYVALWLFSLLALSMLRRDAGFSWRTLWHGAGWDKATRRAAFIRFALIAPLLVLATWYLVPERFFRFPLERPWLWLMVMVFYPVLSVLPQEILFRSFFFTRYAALLSRPLVLVAASAICFGWSHLFLSNFVAPVFSTIGGLIFASSYQKHRSLQWACVEHAVYGCFIFTIGLGWFFYTGNWRH